MPDPAQGLILGPRDEEMLVCLFEHQAMDRGQIQALFFGSVPRCNARLRQLFDWGYVARTYLPSAPYGSQAIYTVGRAAVPFLATRLGMDAGEVRSLCRKGTPTFLEHTLKTVDLYVNLRKETASTPEVEIEVWLSEAACRHEYTLRAAGGVWHKEAFKPDAFVRLYLPAARTYASFFLETDLGHTSSRQFLGKLLGHARYLESGLFAERYGADRFTTLVVTTGPKRLENLRALCQKQGSDLFRFTTFDAVAKEGMLRPIWHSPTEPTPSCLL